MISTEEFNKVKEDFDKVISWSQGVYHPKSDQLLKDWLNAKEYFIDKFGGLIWQSPEKVVFPMDPKDRDVKLNGFIENYVLYRYNNYDLARFLEQEKDGFFDNIVVNEYKTTGGEVIPKGMKLVKAFKYFEELESRLIDLQQKASMIIQENKVEGYFCISVHPLDFLSASENQHNWRSCHALDGEYRVGNLSYLLDKCTVMCYLKSEADAQLPNFPRDVPWNNKKWRMWLHIADEHNALMAGRQYPFTIGGVLDYARQQLFNMLGFSTYRWTMWHHDLLRSYSFTDGTDQLVEVEPTIIMREFVPIKKVVEDAPGSRHFNDLLYSSYYTPWYCWRTSSGVPYHFTIGSEVKCLQCGEHPLEYSDSMYCGYCDHRVECDSCHEYIRDDDYYIVEGDTLCRYCFEDQAVECCNCGEFIYRDNAYYDEDNGNWYCRECWENRND